MVIVLSTTAGQSPLLPWSTRGRGCEPRAKDEHGAGTAAHGPIWAWRATRQRRSATQAEKGNWMEHNKNSATPRAAWLGHVPASSPPGASSAKPRRCPRRPATAKAAARARRERRTALSA
ncbi:unnamed protein product [Prorocentrum cordatum]|uniref:Uncharacterized protein n=1 Tax=Prorocentrum cordatum TaxID=2364126 RepID=A0ABN9V8Y9_9DINO|nr:unnamed protein product [Polarella glacialis]